MTTRSTRNTLELRRDAEPEERRRKPDGEANQPRPLEAAVATIAARDYLKAVSTLEEQIAKTEAGHAHLS